MEKQLSELSVWKKMKPLKQYSNPKKTLMKTKKIYWGSIFATYDAQLNFSKMNISYKN